MDYSALSRAELIEKIEQLESLHNNSNKSENNRSVEQSHPNEELLWKLIQNSPDGIIIVNTRHKIIAINKTIEKLFQYQAYELLGKSIRVLIPERFRDHHKKLEKRYSENPVVKEMSSNIEIYGKRKDGSEFPANIGMGPIQTNEGLVFSTTIRDISKQKQSEISNKEITRELELIKQINELFQKNESDSTIYHAILNAYTELFNPTSIRLFNYNKNENRFYPVASNINKQAAKLLEKTTGIKASEVYPLLKNTQHEEVLKKGKIKLLKNQQEIIQYIQEWKGFIKFKKVLKPILKLIKVKNMAIIPFTWKDKPLSLLIFTTQNEINQKQLVKIDRFSKQITLILNKIKSEQSLKISKTRLKEAQEIAQIGHWELDIDSNRFFWSDEVFRIFGHEPKSINPSFEEFISFIHPNDREQVSLAYSNSLATKTPFNIVHRIIQLNGKERVIREQCKTFYNEQGRPVRSLGTTQDVTEIERAFAKIKLNEERLRAIGNALPDIIFVLNDKGKFIEIQTSKENLLYKDPEDVKGKYLTDIFQEDKAALFLKLINKTIITTQPQKIEYLLDVPEGEIWFEGRTSIMNTEPESQKNVVFIARDITDRKLANETVKDREERLKLATEAGEIGTWDWNIKEDILEWDDMMFKIYEVDKKDFSLDFDAWSKYLNSKEKKLVLEEIEWALNAEKKLDTEFKINTPRGTEKIIRARAEVSFDSKGKPSRMTGVNIDITTQKKFEEKIWRLNEELDERVKQRTHEIEREKDYTNTILNSLPGIFYSINEDGKFDNWNKNLENLLCHSKSEMSQIKVLETVAPEHREQMKEEIQSALDKGFSSNEANIISKEGKKIPFFLSGVSFSRNNKKYIIGTGFDLTDLKRSQEALRKSEILYRTLGDSLPQKVYLKDPELNFISCNSAFASEIETTPTEISGKNDYDFYSDEIAKKYRAEDRVILESGETEKEEKKSIINGKEHWEYVVKTLVKDSNNKVTGILGILWNITDRKKIESDLLKRTEELEVFNNAMVDREMRIIELKEEINKLCKEIGKEIIYPPIW